MNRFSGGRQAVFVGSGLLLASLFAGAQGVPLAAGGNVSKTASVSSVSEASSVSKPSDGAEDAAAAGAVFASLSAYLEEQGVAGFQITDLVVPSPPPPHVALRVAGCRWDALQQEFQCYLRCSVAQACRPFLATIHPRNKKVVAAWRAFVPGGQSSSRDSAQGAGIQGALLPGALARRTLVQRTLAHEVLLVKTGERVRLELAGPGIRIKLPVVCLERGILGQQVRARAVGDTKIFQARVVGLGLLATEFQ